MKGTSLGEFEELVMLTVAVLDDDAYSISVLEELRRRTARTILISSVHKVLIRLEDKGYLESSVGGATDQRGGRNKKLYSVTVSGKQVLEDTMSLRKGLWQDAAKLGWQK